MAISVDPFTNVIYVPKADLTLIQSSPEVRELDVNTFRLWLRDWEDDEANIYRPKTHTHSTEVALAGLTYARIIEILSPYTVEFEDGQYTINCIGANHNVSDVKVANQVSLIVNNAAGLISNAQIEFASFNGGITIDANSPYDGTVFPIGTPQAPVNNISDALLIAQNRGFTTFYITGDLTITESLTLDGFVFVGESMTKTELDIDSDTGCVRCEFYDAHVIGTLDGENMLKNCRLTNLTYVNGVIEQCLLGPGTIILGGSTTAHFLDCWSGVPGTNTPIIDMGGSGQELGLRNYNGGIELRNKNGIDPVSIDLNSGQVVLDSTLTAGTIVIRGVGKLTDNSNGATVLSDDLLSKAVISQAVWDEPIENHLVSGTTGLSVGVQQFNGLVTLDVVNGQAGIDFPIGTERVPVNNIPDAVAIASARGISAFKVRGNITAMGGPFNDYHIYGDGPARTTITCTDLECHKCTYHDVTLTGQFINDSDITTIGCVVTDLYDMQLTAHRTSFGGAVRLIEVDSHSTFYDCYDNIPGIGIPEIKVNTCTSLGIWNWQGGIELTEMITPNTVVSLMIAQGRLFVDSSDVEGDIIVKGLANLVGTTGGTTIEQDGLITKETIAEATWKAMMEKIYVNTSSGNTGSSYPVGTSEYPVNNFADAKLICEAYGVEVLHIHGNATLDESFNGYTIESHDIDASTLDLNGEDISNCTFKELNIIGSGVGHANFNDCHILTGFAGMNCHMENCILEGTFVAAAGGTINGDRCTSPSNAIFNLNGDGSLGMANYSGVITIANVTDAGSTVALTGTYLCTLMSSCTAGQALIAGIGILNDYSTGISITERTVPKTVWNEDVSNFVTDGTVGKELMSKLDRSLGLMQENFHMDNQTYQDYNGAKLLTSARIRTYSDDALTQLLATYQVTATWADGQCTSYQVTKV